MGKQMHAVDARRVIGLFQKTVDHLFGDAVNAAHGRQNPQLITDAHIAIAAAEHLHFTVSGLCRQRGEIGLIAVLIHIAQIGAGVVGMQDFTWPIPAPWRAQSADRI